MSKLNVLYQEGNIRSYQAVGDKYHGVALQELAKLNKPFKLLGENGESTPGVMKYSGKRSTGGTSVDYSRGIPRYLEVQFWMDDGWVNICQYPCIPKVWTK